MFVNKQTGYFIFSEIHIHWHRHTYDWKYCQKKVHTNMILSVSSPLYIMYIYYYLKQWKMSHHQFLLQNTAYRSINIRYHSTFLSGELFPLMSASLKDSNRKWCILNLWSACGHTPRCPTRHLSWPAGQTVWSVLVRFWMIMYIRSCVLQCLIIGVWHLCETGDIQRCAVSSHSYPAFS